MVAVVQEQPLVPDPDCTCPRYDHWRDLDLSCPVHGTRAMEARRRYWMTGKTE